MQVAGTTKRMLNACEAQNLHLLASASECVKPMLNMDQIGKWKKN